MSGLILIPPTGEAVEDVEIRRGASAPAPNAVVDLGLDLTIPPRSGYALPDVAAGIVLPWPTPPDMTCRSGRRSTGKRRARAPEPAPFDASATARLSLSREPASRRSE